MASAAIQQPISLEEPVSVKPDAKPMELAVNQETLLTEVAVVARVADVRGTQPILSHILLETSRGVLTITASDLKRTLRSECPADVKTSGAAAISAQKFLNYLKLLPKGRVSIKLLANQHIQVQAGASRTRMPGRSPSEFPARPSMSSETMRLSSRALKTVLRQSLFAVATGEDRYLLNAALLILREDRMGMVATDGHRLPLVEMVEEDVLFEGLSRTLLPREFMTDLLALLNSSKEESVEFSQDESSVHFRIGPRQLSVRKLVGQFPNYEGIIPRDYTNFTLVRTAELMTSVQRVLEFADERTSGVKLHFADNNLSISSSSPDRGESEETLPVSYAAPPLPSGSTATIWSNS
jgi:DNA polymerase-3 subunit beta